MHAYNTPYTGVLNSSILIIPVLGEEENSLFGLKIAYLTNNEATISQEEAFKPEYNLSHSVFTYSDGKNYQIQDGIKLFNKSYFKIRQGAFILIGLHNSRVEIIDFNKECPYAYENFNRVTAWCESVNFKPVMGFFVNGMDKKPSEWSRIVATDSRIAVPTFDIGQAVPNWDDKYLEETVTIGKTQKVGSNIEIHVNNFDSGLLDIVTRCGVILSNYVDVTNGVGYVHYDDRFMANTSFDIFLEGRRLKTINIFDYSSEKTKKFVELKL